MTKGLITRGDRHNCPCPHCGAINHDLVRDLQVRFDEVAYFSSACKHCGKVVYYQASYEISIIAESTYPFPERSVIDKNDFVW